MPAQDIRWRQRLDSYHKALMRLDDAVALMRERALSDLERQGVIQAFEFTYELAWNLLKDYLEWQGITGIVGSRDTLREAFKRGLVSDGHAWMAMLQDRNRTMHTYNQQTAREIVTAIEARYITHLDELAGTFDALRDAGE